MKGESGLKKIRDSLFGWFLMLVFFAVAGLLLWLFISGMVWASAKVLPWLIDAGQIALGVCLLVLLPLSFFRRTRPWAGFGYVIASFAFGALLLAFSCLVAFQIWHYAGLIIGLVFAGVGVVPVAFLATLLHGKWSLLWNIVLGILLTFGSRTYGLWLTSQPQAFEEKTERRNS